MSLRRRILPGTRVQRLHSSHSYGAVLLLVMATFVFIELAGDAPWTASALLLFQAATLVVALWTSGVAKANAAENFGVLLVAIVGAVALILWKGDTLEGLVGILSAVLTIITVVVIGLGVFDQGEINGQSVIGAITIYLMLGYVFLFLYGLIGTFGKAPLFAQGTDGTRAIRIYFSYITLATVGYGDYTPGTPIGRVTAVTEALMGQLYLVTVIAVLVSRMRPKRRPETD
ncbi:MAG TPA: ion channel [Gaiellaceae bacterium]|nr:ion channel [Gaiellaceae bacterium]